MRKHDINKINLEITDISLLDGAVIIEWNSGIGFGQYIIKQEGNNLVANSEAMDTNTDKAFLKKLLELLIDKIYVRY
jgi:hypothetical protein